MALLDWLLHGTIPVPGGALGAREVIGNLFGLASAILGMKRFVWAWPVGLVGNLLLFTVFATGEFSGAVEEPLWGQAGRQVFFAAVSVYGWWRWSQARTAGGASDGGAIAPRWADASSQPLEDKSCTDSSRGPNRIANIGSTASASTSVSRCLRAA